MFKKLLISTAISTAFLSTPLLAEQTSTSTSMGNDNPQTTAQAPSGSNDAGGQASTEQDTSRSVGTTRGDDSESKSDHKMGAKGETAAQSQDFDNLDRNKDGALDEDELNRFGPTAAGSTTTKGGKDHGKRMLKMHDHDKDGSVSQEEFEKGSKSRSPME